MEPVTFLKYFKGQKHFAALAKKPGAPPGEKIHLHGLVGSAKTICESRYEICTFAGTTLYFLNYVLQFKQKSRCTEIPEPHTSQVHRVCSFSRNLSIPFALMKWRLSIMLMLYFVRYRLSSCFNLEQGNLSQS